MTNRQSVQIQRTPVKTAEYTILNINIGITQTVTNSFSCLIFFLYYIYIFKVHVCSRAFGARHLTVSPVICLLNKSGIPLIFAHSSSSLSSNQLNLSSQTSILAAGQFEEHEQACALMPLLFSFANKSEGYLLRVRIGKGYILVLSYCSLYIFLFF